MSEWDKQREHEKKQAKRFITKITFLCLLAIGLLVGTVTCFGSINIIEDGTIGVVRQFGEITESITPGGFNMRLSWIHDVEVFDLRTREANMEFSAYTVDGLNVTGIISIQYRLDASAVQRVAREFGSLEQLESMVHAMFNQQILNTISRRTAMYWIEYLYLLEVDLMSRITTEQEIFHISVTNVALERMRFSDSFRAAVDARIIAGEEYERRRIEADTERINIGLEENRREMETRIIREVAEAEAFSIEAVANAEAAAIEARLRAWDNIDPAVRDIMLQQLAVESWDGVLPRTIVGGDDGGFSLILDSIS